MSIGRDRRLLLTGAAVRAAATSLIGVLLGVHLARLGFGSREIGWISGLGLAGVTLAALLVTMGADRWGRRRTLLVLTTTGVAGGAALLLSSSFWLLALAAFGGMVNAMGRDRGASGILEQTLIPAVATHERRTLAFAWLHMARDAGSALGALLAGLPTWLEHGFALSPTEASRGGLALYPLLLAASIPLYACVSPAVERGTGTLHSRLSPTSRRIISRLSILFALDGLGGGLLLTTLVAYFFFERFGVEPGGLALLFFGVRLANIASYFGAAWLARRIGLVNTMVWTHLPASLLLIAVAMVPSLPWAVALFLARELLVEMDVPTRESYTVAVVGESERLAAAGRTNLVRLATWAIGPVAGGVAMRHLGLGAPLVIGAGLKILYDLALWTSFRRLRPPEEH
ncbi:MAG: MFS transporter [Thermoanaerobaculia bacterium]